MALRGTSRHDRQAGLVSASSLKAQSLAIHRSSSRHHQVYWGSPGAAVLAFWTMTKPVPPAGPGVPLAAALFDATLRFCEELGDLWCTLKDVSPVPVKPVRLQILRDVPHVIPYQGSKRALAHAIIPLLPEDTSTLIEPFAGSAAITIAARYSGVAKNAIISDINAPLMALWERILADPKKLADDYESLWLEQQQDPRTFYDAARVKFNATKEPHLLLYLLARCVKAAVRYSKSGDFNQSPDNRRLGAVPSTMRRRLVDTSRTLGQTVAASGDYADLLSTADRSSVVYMDPPYQGVSNVRDHRYMRGLERLDFEEHLRNAVNAGVSFILSYDAVTESKKYGDAISSELDLTHLHVIAGRSSQATLQGISKVTVESLYLSPALVERLGGEDQVARRLGGPVASTDQASGSAYDWAPSCGIS
jgi:DNA adenine methylase